MVILAPALSYTGAACRTDNPVRAMSPASVSGIHVAARVCEVDLPTQYKDFEWLVSNNVN